MSSSAKRLVQSLRGRSSGSSGGGRTGSARSDSRVGDNCSGTVASTSATRLFHCDSGHELDEISVIARGTGDLVLTPTTPYHCISGGPSLGSSTAAIRYGSGQTLYSIAGSVPPAPAAPRISPGGKL